MCRHPLAVRPPAPTVNDMRARPRPRLLWLLLAATLLTGLLAGPAAPSTPVLADATEDPLDDGSNRPGDNVSEYKKGTIRCVNGEGWQADATGKLIKRLYSYPFSQCVPGICLPSQWSCTWAITVDTPGPDFVYCQTHAEVWRFYGTRSQPVKSYTVSRVYLRWCENNPVVQYHYPHPNDANQMLIAGSSNPFQARAVANGYKVGPGVQETIYISQPSSSVPGGTYTTAPPFIRNGSCTAIISSDSPYAAMTPEAQQMLLAKYNAWAPQFSNVTSRAMANLASISPLVWDDNITCSSGAEFGRPKSVADSNPGELPVYGACWIPVERYAAMFTGPSMAVPNWTNTVHRYDTDRYSYRYSSASQPYHSNWRQAIADEVSRRPGGPVPPQNGSQMWTPGDPYSSSNRFSETVNRAAAATAAANYSRCEDGPLSNTMCEVDCGGNIVEEDTTEPSASVSMSVSAPNNFLVGGETLRQSVTATASNFTCSNCTSPGSPKPYIERLIADIQVAGTGGYRQYKSVSGERQNLTSFCSESQLASSSGCSTSEVLEFYRSSDPGQGVRVALSGSGSVVAFPERKTVTVPSTQTCLPSAPGCMITIVFYPPETLPIKINWGVRETVSPVISSSAVWRK